MDKEVLSQLQALPDPCYLRFCERYLLREGVSRVDPFSIVVPDVCLRRAYVHRAEVERAVLDSTSPLTLILAPCGRGKTTLMQVGATLGQPEGALVVGVQIAYATGGLLNEDIGNQNAGLRLRQAILRSVFTAFWGVLQRSEHPQPYLTGRQQDLGWMERLRCVYQHLEPIPLRPLDDPILMDWLRSQPATIGLPNKLSPVQLLQELISVITSPPLRTYGTSLSKYHTKVLILLDTDSLSYPEIVWLIQEGVLRLSIQLPEYCQVVLLLDLDSTWEDQFLKAAGWVGARVALYELPSWTELELKKLLRLRLVAWGADPELPSDWGSTLLSAHLRPDAQRAFVDEIASSALKAAESKGSRSVDAPIHALRLARWVLTKLATEDPSSMPVSLETVRKYIRQYLDALERLGGG